MTPEEYRRTMGMDLIAAERRLQRATQSLREKAPQPDPRKQADEQCQGVDGELLKGIVLGLADSEGGETD